MPAATRGVRLAKTNQLGFRFGFAKKTAVFGFTKLTAVSSFSVRFMRCVLFNVYALYWVLFRLLFL